MCHTSHLSRVLSEWARLESALSLNQEALDMECLDEGGIEALRSVAEQARSVAVATESYAISLEQDCGTQGRRPLLPPESLLDGLNEDERAVALEVLRESVSGLRVGRVKHGPLNLASDRRDHALEAEIECRDQANWRAMARIKKTMVQQTAAQPAANGERKGHGGQT